ncbi:hypothetical protein [Dolichospermum flos-aquae]|jgi:hypothetical protein|uniref:Uncharacterized protein n=1 Tax=Dolichospermum flos-aquae CCAP 1403/13F TaxID=315271 RepID=A0A6H2BZX6_DOLFA|nr:hypothetical protein [Dolichospermum flos-aquae]QJB44279.1 hypothetical protein HGD76_08855 [Dolichospermum flos-aquae CCAP 1403/13F]
MRNFELVIRGTGAEEAAKDLNQLLADVGISGTLDVPDEVKQKTKAEPIEAIILSFVLNVTASVVADRINEFIRQHDRSRSNNTNIEYIIFKNKSERKREQISFPLDDPQNTSEKVNKVLEDEDF